MIKKKNENVEKFVETKTPYNEKTFKLRGLTHGETKRLKESGLHPHYSQKSDKIAEDFTDWVLDNIYPETNFDDLPHMKAIKLAGETFKLTYSSEEEIKNS